MKTEIIQKIAEHLEHAETKHPLFCVRICGEGTTLENVKALLKRSRENREKFKTADCVLSEEVQEVFEAYLEGRYEDCREEIYDTIAVLLRMDKKIVNIIKAINDECAETEAD